VHLLAHEAVQVAFERTVKGVEDALAHLDCVDDVVLADAFDGEDCVVVLLASGSGVDGGIVKNEDVRDVLLENVVEHLHDLGVVLHQGMVLVKHAVGFRQV